MTPSFKVLVGIALSWVLAGLTGFVPVFTGIYSDPSVLAEHQMVAEADTTMTCDLVPNKVNMKTSWKLQVVKKAVKRLFLFDLSNFVSLNFSTFQLLPAVYLFGYRGQ